MTESHDYLAKVRALLDTAESLAAQGTEEAAENYRVRAFALMAKYGIEEHMLAARTHRDEKPIRREVPVPSPYSRDKSALLHCIATPIGVQTIRSRTASGGAVMYLVGFESDLDRVEILYTSLLVQAFGALAKANVWCASAAEKTSYNKNWLGGFAARVHGRIKQAEERARQDYEAETGASTALVVRDRSEVVRDSYQELFPERRRGRTKRVTDYRGFAAGQQAGDRADIGHGRLDGQRGELPV